ncbi:carbamoyltransferase family protein [Chitinophagaceae bacterium MMS25-I14]
MKTKPVYILGTGLSHDGSACILKDGDIAIAIEKERITRRKHDGGNDLPAVQYCLDALGISIEDISLIVQAANFEKDIDPGYYRGKRIFHPDVPVVTISHHLAHAWSAIGTSPFRKTNVLVIDGAGSPALQCDDWPDERTQKHWTNKTGFFCEKDSFYHYAGGNMQCLYKDFSEVRLFDTLPGKVRMPVTSDSIGGVYAAASNYCFGNLDDAGKLMGLAPYGSNTYAGRPLFLLQDGKAETIHESFAVMNTPADDYEMFKSNFNHYADIAGWVQKETERAVAYIVQCRMELFPAEALCYAGGVALNAVANALLLKKNLVKQLYMQPAAGDNGLAVGCAFYGWQQVLGHEIVHKKKHSVSLGKKYTRSEVEDVLCNHPERKSFEVKRSDDFVNETAVYLFEGKVVAWFQGGAEFGPRSLGHRSILASPALRDIQLHINTNIKFREDFRPFAPAVLKEDMDLLFKNGWESPYMILVDEIKDEWRSVLPGIIHVDGTCRVQTVDEETNPIFAALLHAFKTASGIPALVNTSFNRRGMPIVETPAEAVDFFLSCALDVLVIHNYMLTKTAL